MSPIEQFGALVLAAWSSGFPRANLVRNGSQRVGRLPFQVTNSRPDLGSEESELGLVALGLMDAMLMIPRYVEKGQ